MPRTTNQGLRKLLLAKKGVSPQAISQSIKRLRGKLGALSTEDGWGVLAALQGIDVSKYLGADEVARIRDLVSRLKSLGGEPMPMTTPRARRGTRPRRTTDISIAPSLDSVDPILPSSVAAEAKMMAEQVYPRFYVLENSIRNFILRVMEGTHGKDWWDNCAPPDIQKKVAGRMRSEERVYWHARRNAHPIYYCDFPHLADIVDQNAVDFHDFLPEKGFLTQKISELNISRRVAAHFNPLSKHDRLRLEVYCRDWESHIAGIAGSLP